MECYERILKDASKVLNKTNIILFEHGYKQKELMINLVDKYFPNSECEVIKDLSGNDRITVIINK
jgi:methylase of polypeptide subunit release factors